MPHLDPLILLIAVVALLTACAALFALSAIGFRIAHERRDRRRQALESRWEPAVLDFLSDDRPAGAFWRQVPSDAEELAVDYLLRLGRRLRGEELDRLGELASPYLGTIALALASRQMDRRALAVETLGLLGRGLYHPRIAEMLDDPAPLVVILAARVLVRDPERRHVEDVAARIPRLGAWSRRLLSSMFASMGPEAAPALRRMLADVGRAPELRAVVADALRFLNDLESADLADTLVRTEDDRELVAAALRLLARVGRPSHVGTVLAVLGREDFVLRAHAVTALANLGSEAHAERLEGFLDDPSPWVATHAANGLRRIGQLSRLSELAASEHPRAELARQVLEDVRGAA